MAYIDEIIARLPENGTGEISATDLQECFSLVATNNLNKDGSVKFDFLESVRGRSEEFLKINSNSVKFFGHDLLKGGVRLNSTQTAVEIFSGDNKIIITENGMTAPYLDAAKIVDPRSLVTKEYVDGDINTLNIQDDHAIATPGQAVFHFFKKAAYVQVFGDGIKHSIDDPNNALVSVNVDNTGNGGTGLITVSFSSPQAAGTYIEVICFN